MSTKHGYVFTYRTSTSGLLCRSTTCDEKLSRHIAAVNVWRTAFRYGCNVADYHKHSTLITSPHVRLPYWYTKIAIYSDTVGPTH